MVMSASEAFATRAHRRRRVGVALANLGLYAAAEFVKATRISVCDHQPIRRHQRDLEYKVR